MKKVDQEVAFRKRLLTSGLSLRRRALDIKALLYVAIFVLLAPCRLCLGTSIISPGFDRPIVCGGIIVAHPVSGDGLIGLNANNGTLLWRREAAAVFALDSNTVLAVRDGIASVVDVQNGGVLKSMKVTAPVFGCSPDGNVFSLTKDDVIICQQLSTGRRVWETACTQPDSNFAPRLRGDFIFLSYSPCNIAYSSDGASTAMGGTNMIACLAAKDGQMLWSEAVPLNHEGFGVSLRIAEGKREFLCATDNDLRLLDKKSGAIVRRLHIEKDMDGADFWGDDRIVVCVGGIGATTRTLEIRALTDFQVLDQFNVEALECSSITTIKDVVILSSLNRERGVDLRSRAVVWLKEERNFTPYNGVLYYGGYTDGERVLGVCDPKTGSERRLYAESSVRVTPEWP